MPSRPAGDLPEVVSFDCYGTLVDWESGLLSALRPILRRHGAHLPDAEILRMYAELEPEAESGPFCNYRAVLAEVVAGFGRRLGFTPDDEERSCLAASLPGWAPFPDTVGALRAIGARLRLAVISNVDEDLFAATAARLGVAFDLVVTAESVGAYKPSERVFRAAIERIGVAPGRILHAAQSLYHDIGPARSLGMATVWVNRRSATGGPGATPPSTADPDAEVRDLAGLVRRLGLP